MATATLDPVSTSHLFTTNRVRSEVVFVTPSLASVWLKSNVRNRPLSRRHVDTIKQVLLRNEYRLNGEAITFSESGALLNGQHRLTACVETGVAFETLVVTGVDDDAFATIDGGRKRQNSDILAIGGEKNATCVAACIQAVVAFVESGGVFTHGGIGSKHKKRVTPTLACQILERHPGIRDSVATMKKGRWLNNRDGYCLHYLFSIADKPLAAEFANVIATGGDNTRRPFYVLRERLISRPRTAVARREIASVTIKAWNAEMECRKIRSLRYSEAAEFPVISGLPAGWYRKADILTELP